MTEELHHSHYKFNGVHGDWTPITLCNEKQENFMYSIHVDNPDIYERVTCERCLELLPLAELDLKG